jgi:hypothetical protein
MTSRLHAACINSPIQSQNHCRQCPLKLDIDSRKTPAVGILSPKNFGTAFFVEMCWGLCLACLALSVGAIVKLNPSGGLPWMWSAPSTWSSNSVPTQDDDVEVDFGGKFACDPRPDWYLSVDASFKCKSLIVGASTTMCSAPLRIESGVTLTVETALFFTIFQAVP